MAERAAFVMLLREHTAGSNPAVGFMWKADEEQSLISTIFEHPRFLPGLLTALTVIIVLSIIGVL